MAEKLSLNHDKLIRWLRGLAAAAVTAAGSRATFTSDMYFEAADAIGNLHADKVFLIEAARSFIGEIEDTPLASCREIEGLTSFRALREAVNRMGGE